MRIRGKLLKPRPTPRGHLEVVLCRDGESVDSLIHVLVLTAFRGPRPPGKQCRHLDSDPANNYWANLLWGTAVENAQDRVANNRRECCDYEHPLRLPNLVANALRAGHYQCKACHYAYAARRRARLRGQVVDFRAMADAYHAKILTKAS